MGTTITGHFATMLPGGWFIGFTPSAAQLQTWDQSISQAVNGDGGGTYAPTTRIVIGGSGFEIASGAEFVVDSGAEAFFNGTGVVNGSFNFFGTASAQFLNTAALSFTNAATCSFNEGSALSFAGTSTMSFAAGTTATWANGSGITLGGELTLASTGLVSATAPANGWLFTNGKGIVIADATNPVFVSTRSRTIAQPMSIASSTSAPSYNYNLGFAFQDNNTSPNYLPMTKVINGATIDGFSIIANILNVHTPGSAARVTLYRYSVNSEAQTVLASASVPTGTFGPQTISVTGFGGVPGTVVDDSQYTYFLQLTPEGGANAEPITWLTPTLSFVNITQLGQF